MDPSAPGRALAQFLHPWETRLQGCRASQHLAKPLWLPAVCEGFSPLSWRRAVAPGKPFLRKLEQGWQLRSAVRACASPAGHQPSRELSSAATTPHSAPWTSLGRGTRCKHKTTQGSAGCSPSPSGALPGLPRQQQHLSVACAMLRGAGCARRGAAGAAWGCGTAHARAGLLPTHPRRPRAGTGVQPCTVAPSGAQCCVQRTAR